MPADPAPPAQPGAGPLTHDQLADFARDGFLLCPEFLDAASHAALLAEADRLVELVVNSTIALGRRNPRADIMYDESGNLVIRRISPVADASAPVARIASSTLLTAAMAQLVGVHPVLIESKLNYKQRFADPPAIPFLPRRAEGDQWPLHHDWGYYRQQGYPTVAVSVALSLDDSAGRGPMIVVPGSHRTPAVVTAGDPDSGTGRVVAGSVAAQQRVVGTSARAALFFHCQLVHASPPNPSPCPRRILLLTYAPEFSDGTAALRRNGRWQEHAARFDLRYARLTAASPAAPPFTIEREESTVR